MNNKYIFIILLCVLAITNTVSPTATGWNYCKDISPKHMKKQSLPRRGSHAESHTGAKELELEEVESSSGEKDPCHQGQNDQEPDRCQPR